MNPNVVSLFARLVCSVISETSKGTISPALDHSLASESVDYLSATSSLSRGRIKPVSSVSYVTTPEPPCLPLYSECPGITDLRLCTPSRKKITQSHPPRLKAFAAPSPFPHLPRAIAELLISKTVGLHSSAQAGGILPKFEMWLYRLNSTRQIHPLESGVFSDSACVRPKCGRQPRERHTIRISAGIESATEQRGQRSVSVREVLSDRKLG